MAADDYFKLLERIVKGAEYLDNPLITQEDYQKGMQLYHALCEKVFSHQEVGSMNRWQVYNWMKHRYLNTGIEPTRDEVMSTFPKLSLEELQEGITEFKLTTGRRGIGP